MAQAVGIDSVIFIYLLEENQRYLAKVRRILGFVQRGKINGVFSSVGLIEILTGPKKQGRHDLAAQYRELIVNFPHLTIMGLSEHIVELASDMRAKYGIATPDAIHLATAIDFGASRFITNDKTLKRISEIRVEVL